MRKKHEFIYGKTDGFNSLEELENASECIVRVKKESEDVSPSGFNEITVHLGIRWDK